MENKLKEINWSLKEEYGIKIKGKWEQRLIKLLDNNFKETTVFAQYIGIPNTQEVQIIFGASTNSIEILKTIISLSLFMSTICNTNELSQIIDKIAKTLKESVQQDKKVEKKFIIGECKGKIISFGKVLPMGVLVLNPK